MPSDKDGSGTPGMNPHFFKREADGSVRIRIRFSPEEASLIEEAAGKTPVILYIHRVLGDRARYHIRKRAEIEGTDDEDDDKDTDSTET